jgi:hypothetical protein
MRPELLDEWKIIPRIMMLAITILSWRVVEWFMQLPDPSMQQSGLVSVVLGALTGCFAVWMGKEHHPTSLKSKDTTKIEK